jgi:hypothetical protein
VSDTVLNSIFFLYDYDEGRKHVVVYQIGVGRGGKLEKNHPKILRN